MAVADQGFCSSTSMVDSGLDSKHLYWKVTNPTLSPSHLQGLIAFYKEIARLARIHMQCLQMRPCFNNTRKSRHDIRSLVDNAGDGFTLCNVPGKDARFIFVVLGAVTLTYVSGISHKLTVDSYAYPPPHVDHSLRCDASAALVVFERRHVSLKNQSTAQIIGSTDEQPLLETPGEVFQLMKLIPTSISYDFNIHIMDFQLVGYLNVGDHYNQHGLLLLEGQGIYRLGDSWYPVQAGDAIWMAPFVPQWYAALGKSRTPYLLYKDVNRNPL